MKTVLNIGLFFGLFTVVSCSSFQIPKLDNYMPPVVSIDSVFRTSGIRDGDYHALRLTKAFSMAMDSLERDSVLRFQRNYALDNKVPSVYSISAILMPAKREGSTLVVPSFQGFIRDNVSTESTYCSCFGTDSRDWGCYSILQNVTVQITIAFMTTLSRAIRFFPASYQCINYLRQIIQN